MSRTPPPQPRRSSFDRPDELDAFDRSIGRFHPGHEGEDQPLGEYFGALLNSPPLTWIACQFGTFVRTAGERDDSYSHRDREFVDQVLCADWNTNTVQMVHIPDAVQTGIAIEVIEGLRSGDESMLSDDDRFLARFIRATVAGEVTDDDWQAMVDRLGVRGAIEYTAFILWLQWILRMMQALGVEDPTDAEVDELIAELKAEGPSEEVWRSRIR